MKELLLSWWVFLVGKSNSQLNDGNNNWIKKAVCFEQRTIERGLNLRTLGFTYCFHYHYIPSGAPCGPLVPSEF